MVKYPENWSGMKFGEGSDQSFCLVELLGNVEVLRWPVVVSVGALRKLGTN